MPAAWLLPLAFAVAAAPASGFVLPRSAPRGFNARFGAAAVDAEALRYPSNAKTLTVGSALPTLALHKNESPDSDLAAVLAPASSGTKTVLVGVPGAFTPTCSENHVPGFLNAMAALKGEGVGKVVVLSVNDKFVMKAWGAALGVDAFADGEVALLADGQGAVAAALGLLVDKGDMGGRCVRCAVVVDNGVVTYAGIDDKGLDKSSVESVLGFFAAERAAAEAKAAAEAAAKAAAADKAVAAAKAAGAGVDSAGADNKGVILLVAAAAAAAAVYVSQVSIVDLPISM